jgi:hypothetical protein
MKKRRNRRLVCRVTAEGIMLYPTKPVKPEKKPHVFLFGRMITIKRSELPQYQHFNIVWL